MESLARLRQICQAGKDVDPGWYFAHRRLSIYVTWLLLHTSVTPNHVSLVMMFLGGVGAALLASTRVTSNVAGFAILYLTFLLDKVDGEIARYRGMRSPRGILLDRFHHRLIEPLIFVAPALRIHTLTGSTDMVLVALVLVLVANMIEENQHLSAYILFKHLRGQGQMPQREAVKEAHDLRMAYTMFRPLKGLRMFIVALPLAGIAYCIEWTLHWPATRYYLYGTLAGLSLYFVFQCLYYFRFKLAAEMAVLNSVMAGDGNETYDPEGSVMKVGPTMEPGSNPAVQMDIAPGGPRKVSGEA